MAAYLREHPDTDLGIPMRTSCSDGSLGCTDLQAGLLAPSFLAENYINHFTIAAACSSVRLAGFGLVRWQPGPRPDA